MYDVFSGLQWPAKRPSYPVYNPCARNTSIFFQDDGHSVLTSTSIANVLKPSRSATTRLSCPIHAPPPPNLLLSQQPPAPSGMPLRPSHSPRHSCMPSAQAPSAPVRPCLFRQHRSPDHSINSLCPSHGAIPQEKALAVSAAVPPALALSRTSHFPAAWMRQEIINPQISILAVVIQPSKDDPSPSRQAPFILDTAWVRKSSGRSTASFRPLY